MLRLAGGQVESLLDELLPVEVRELPEDLAALDRLLADRRLLAPIEQAWEWTARRHGRPTIPMTSFVRLMVIKQRTGWGYQTLVREVSDSLHLRRFCLLPLTQRVPDESTVRKLVRRLGPGDGRRADPGGDRQGAAGDPLCRPCRADRLDRGRG
jgi:IS5 family transposase